jgi:hypothetical protein
MSRSPDHTAPRCSSNHSYQFLPPPAPSLTAAASPGDIDVRCPCCQWKPSLHLTGVPGFPPAASCQFVLQQRNAATHLRGGANTGESHSFWPTFARRDFPQASRRASKIRPRARSTWFETPKRGGSYSLSFSCDFTAEEPHS